LALAVVANHNIDLAIRDWIMNAKIVPPAMGANSFTCPHCGAVAHQSWVKLFGIQYAKDEAPFMPNRAAIERLRTTSSGMSDPQSEMQREIANFFERKLTKEVFIDAKESSSSSRSEIANLGRPRPEARKVPRAKGRPLWPLLGRLHLLQSQ
jgi:hypothetical protein